MTTTEDELPLISRAPTLASQTYMVLKERIVRGELAPDTHQSEAELARQLGISRAPLREALRQLAEEGFVESDSRGVRVTALTQRHVWEMYEVRFALEGQAAAMSFGEIPETQIKDAAALLKRLEKQVLAGDVDEFIANDVGFHDLWVSNSSNDLLIQYTSRLRDHIRRASNHARGLVLASTDALREHQAILKALQRGDAGDFRTAVENHISRTAVRMLTAFPAGEAEPPDRPFAAAKGT